MSKPQPKGDGAYWCGCAHCDEAFFGGKYDLVCPDCKKRLAAYTASIDVALTLVPNDLAFGMKRAPCQRSHAMLATIGEEWSGVGAAPALAICAAALRASAAA